jgi:hypothetical protein
MTIELLEAGQRFRIFIPYWEMDSGFQFVGKKVAKIDRISGSPLIISTAY